MLRKAYAAHHADGAAVLKEGIDELSFLNGTVRPSTSNSASSRSRTPPASNPIDYQTSKTYAPPPQSPPHPHYDNAHIAHPLPPLSPPQLMPLPSAFSLGGQHLHQTFAGLTGGWSPAMVNSYVPPSYSVQSEFDRQFTYTEEESHQEQRRMAQGYSIQLQQQQVHPSYTTPPQYPLEDSQHQHHHYHQLQAPNIVAEVSGRNEHWETYQTFNGGPVSYQSTNQ